MGLVGMGETKLGMRTGEAGKDGVGGDGGTVMSESWWFSESDEFSEPPSPSPSLSVGGHSDFMQVLHG